MRLLIVVNVDWFFLSHRLQVALAALRAGYKVHIATTLTHGREKLEALGFVVHPLDVNRSGAGPIGLIKLFVTYLFLFWKIRPDILHLVTIKPVLVGGAAARFSPIRGVVFAISGLGHVFIEIGIFAKLRRNIIMACYRFVFGFRNLRIIFQNPDDRDTLMAATGLLDSQIEMIRGSGVDLNQYTEVPEATGVPVVLLPARLLVEKGVFEFVAAARLLRAKGLAARFVLAGLVDTANPTRVSQIDLDAWLTEGVVEHWGYRSDMPQVLSSASVVVLPSYREGMPKALLEAAACGRAVVTTDVPGCRAAIEPGVTGLLVPVREVESLADSIELLLTHPKLRKSMGIAGRRLAVQEFDVCSVVEKHLGIYRRLLALH